MEASIAAVVRSLKSFISTPPLRPAPNEPPKLDGAAPRRPHDPLRSVIVTRQTFGLRDPLVFDGRFENRAGLHLADNTALDFLPGRLVLRVMIATIGLQLPATGVELVVRNQDIRLTTAEVDTDPVAGL